MNPKLLLPACGLALTLTMAVLFVLLLEPAQAREVAAACNGLRPAPTNPAYICPTPSNPNAPCEFPVSAKNFELVNADGDKVTLADYRGKVVLVNFWASWCNVCKSEKPSLEHLHAGLSDTDFTVLAVASDNKWGKVRMALPEESPLPVLLDPPQSDDENLGMVAKAWGLKAVPESFLIDRNGVIRYYFINKRDWDSGVAQTCIRSLLDE